MIMILMMAVILTDVRFYGLSIYIFTKMPI